VQGGDCDGELVKNERGRRTSSVPCYCWCVLAASSTRVAPWRHEERHDSVIHPGVMPRDGPATSVACL